MGDLFPDRAAAVLTLAFHARLAWQHREAVSRALRRDDDTCCRCATRIPGWMEIHHRDGNHRDWREENLAAICHFCHLACHPAQGGYERAEFPLEMTWWPEVTQGAISAFTWAVIWLQAALGPQVEAEEAAARLTDEIPPEGLSTRLAGFLKEISGELMSRRAVGLGVINRIGTASPSDLLSSLLPTEPEPDRWAELRFLPTHLRKATVAAGPGQIHRVLSGGRIDQVDLRVVLHGQASGFDPNRLLAVADDLRRRAAG